MYTTPYFFNLLSILSGTIIKFDQRRKKIRTDHIIRENIH